MTSAVRQVSGFRELFEILQRNVRDAGKWWPAETKFEILVGGVLTQNTTWTSVEKSLENLRKRGLLDPMRLAGVKPDELETLIRPSGFMRAKSQYLKNLTEWYIKTDARAGEIDTPTLRNSLLRVPGVGEETADDILLYAYDRPVFIFDTYARRLLVAAGLGEFRTYRQAKQVCDAAWRVEGFTVAELAIFHGLVVQAGKDARREGSWEGILRA